MLRLKQFTNAFIKQGLLSSEKNIHSVRNFSSMLIKNGTVINADRQFKADVVIEGSKISGVFNPAQKIATQKTFDRVFDASGKFIMPGGIDPHVHMELPFMGQIAVDDFDIGSKAAVAGGTTSFIDFVIPGEEGLLHAYNDWRTRADKKVHCDYTLHCAITHWNPQVSKDMEEIVKKGISSFKLFTAYKGTSFFHNDERMLEIFARCRELGATMLVHAENGDIISYNQNRLLKQGVIGPEGHALSRPDEVEAEATHRVVTLANAVSVPLYIVHVMKKGANDEIVRAKRKGNVVFAEALAAGLGTDGHHYWDKDWDHAAGYVMSPVIDEDPATKEYQMRLVHTHDIDTTATDNCTFCTSQKRAGKDAFTKIPNGCNGIEDRMSVIWTKGVNTGIITPSDFVRVTSSQTARIFNMYPKKGIIQAEADADIVIWDPNAEKTISKKTHHHAVDFNIFEGMRVKGLTETTISGGRVVYHEGVVTSKPGSGKYIPRENYGFAYERIGPREIQRKIRETPVNRTDNKKRCS
jgi:dihydropyrimidinase